MPTIAEAIEAYLAEREFELSDSSLQNHRYQLKQFRIWGASVGVDSIEELDPIALSKFRRARSDDINSNTMYNQLSVLRLFLRFTHRMGWVEESLADSIVLPTRDGRARDSTIDPDRVASILDELERYRYASLDHVILSMIWTASLRIGALRGLDVGDVHAGDEWFDVVHRPETETPLKNAGDSEREVNLHGWVCDVLRAWINDRRPGVQDSHGEREPLLATQHGRIARSSIRRRIYKLTSCGSLGQGCECGADPITHCDDVVAPHDIRRSSITAWLNDGADKGLLSDRVDTESWAHYDVRDPSQKREARRDAFDM
jgi:site-specific recombinase XerC